MAELKTKSTSVDPADFIAAVPDPARRADEKAVADLLARLTGEPATMWGPSIVGFGRYSYQTSSGTAEMCRIGFSPRKSELVLYGLGAAVRDGAALANLGKHKTGKGCLYIKRLADIDLDNLAGIIAACWRSHTEIQAT